MKLLSFTLVCSFLVAPWKADLPLAPPKHGGVYVVAHRGAHQGIPENTLPAYQKAIDLGCDFVEIDVRTTKDGKLVSVHNSSIDAYVANGATGKVRDLTLEELRKLDVGTKIDPKWAGTQIPTVEEILDLCKGKIGIYLDHKDANTEQVAALIQERGMEHQVIWYSMPQQIKRLREQCPECIEMPEGGDTKYLPGLLKDVQPRVVAATWDNYSKEYVETIHAAGAKVIVDESDSSCWQQALDWKSDGIQTDDPEGLIEFLKARK